MGTLYSRGDIIHSTPGLGSCRSLNDLDYVTMNVQGLGMRQGPSSSTPALFTVLSLVPMSSPDQARGKYGLGGETT